LSGRPSSREAKSRAAATYSSRVRNFGGVAESASTSVIGSRFEAISIWPPAACIR
jgi:hypothetical protein